MASNVKSTTSNELPKPVANEGGSMASDQSSLAKESNKVMNQLLESLSDVSVSSLPHSEHPRRKASCDESFEPIDEENLPRSEVMYLRALEARRAKERKQKVIEEKLKRRAVPRLSVNSRKIAASMDQTSRERLLQPSHSSQRRKSEVVKPTFKPAINPKSNELVHNDWKNAFARLYQESVERRRRKDVLTAKNPRAVEELKACTFKPKVRPYKSNYDKSEDHGEKVETRLRDWERRRQEKLAVQQKVQEQAGLAPEYTFQPNVNKPRRRKSSTTGKGSLKCSGLDKFLERQKKARMERERVKGLQSHSTKKWSNRVTVPRAPVLGTQERSRRKGSRHVDTDSILNYTPKPDMLSPPLPPRAPPPVPNMSPPPASSVDASGSVEADERKDEDEMDNFALLRKLLRS